MNIMVTVVGKNGLALPTHLSISKRERNFILRLLNKNVDLDVGDEELIDYLSNHKNLLVGRHSCGPVSPLRHFEGEKAPPELIIKSLKNEIIEEANFNWIDTSNDRLCNYVWSYIRSMTQYPVTTSTLDIGIKIESSIDPSFHMGHLYNQFNLESSPPNNSSKKNCIISFFDILNSTNEQKICDVGLLKAGWLMVSKKMDVASWIEKCDDEWAWNYLFSNKKTGNNRAPVWFINKDKPSTIKDCIVTLFDLLNEVPPSRTLAFRDMKSAWSQKAYRDKNNNKKAVSIVLHEDIIKELDFICRKDGRRKNEVVTKLIQEEYDKIKKSGR